MVVITHMSSRMAPFGNNVQRQKQSRPPEHAASDDSLRTKAFPGFVAHRSGCRRSGALISSCKKAFFFSLLGFLQDLILS